MPDKVTSVKVTFGHSAHFSFLPESVGGGDGLILSLNKPSGLPV